jgi:hypothetical protein
MKLVELMSVGVRLCALLMLVLLLRDTPQWISALSNAGGEHYGSLSHYDHSIYYVIWAAVFMATLIMLKFPLTIANFLLTRTEKESPELEIDGKSLTIAGFTILGVYILSWAVPGFIHNAMYIWHLTHYSPTPDALLTETIISEITTAIEIVIGLYLAVSANGLLMLLRKLRAA